MATKKPAKKTTKRAPSTKSTGETKVTRVKASDTTSTKKPAVKKAVVAEKVEKSDKKEQTSSRNPLKAIGGYFAGAWYELRQVRWPDRRATWSMTGALIGFTLFFVVVILLLDALFQWLFSLVIGK